MGDTDAQAIAAKALSDAADEVRYVRENGLRPGSTGAPYASHFESWLRERAADYETPLLDDERQHDDTPMSGEAAVQYVAVPDELTDLPDAVVEAAAEVISDGIDRAHGNGVPIADWAICEEIARAALAAASGPWAEQLDAANTERDEAKRRALHAMNQRDEERRMKEGNIKALDAALARNAELQDEVDEWKSEADDQREAFVWANGACQEQATQKWAAIAERDSLRAELDNLRETLAQKIEAEKYDSDVPTTLKEQGRNWGLDEAAAIVRGSDDEAGEDA